MENTNPCREYEEILLKFEQLPRKKVSRTFMQIARYPHYENVCSNILAFYLDPSEEHGMRDLLLKALLVCLRLPIETAISDADISREAGTETGKRLDLVVNAGDFIIGIENKIYAGLYNDLQDYAGLLTSIAKESAISDDRIYKIVLTLHPLSALECSKIDEQGFVNLTYKELIAQARALLGDYAADSDTKFLAYFIDFMQTLEKLQSSPIDSEEAKFFRKNGAAIHRMDVAFWKFINERVPAVEAYLKQMPIWQAFEAKAASYTIYAKHTFCIWISNPTNELQPGLTIQAKVEPSLEWYVWVTGWNKDSVNYFKEVQSRFEDTLTVKGFVVRSEKCDQTLSATTADIEIAQLLNDIITATLSAMGFDINVILAGGLNDQRP